MSACFVTRLAPVPACRSSISSLLHCCLTDTDTHLLVVPAGLRTLTTVWAEHLSDEVKRRFYRNWYASKHKAFTKYAAAYASGEGRASANDKLGRMKSYASVVRVIAHTQVRRRPLFYCVR